MMSHLSWLYSVYCNHHSHYLREPSSSTNVGLSVLFLVVTKDIFHGPWSFMKMEEKQCTRCRQPLSLECFRISKPTGQLTKCLVKCLEKSKQQTKCKHKGQISYWKDCGGSQICEHNKQRSKCKDCDGVEFVSTIGKDQNARIVTEVKFVNTTREDQSAPRAIPLDTLLGSYEVVFLLL